MNDDKMPSFVRKYKKEVTTIQQYIFENEPEYKKLGLANAKKKQETNNYNCSNAFSKSSILIFITLSFGIMKPSNTSVKHDLTNSFSSK